MKRIETLDETHRFAIRNTLNVARIEGGSAYACPGSGVNCKYCPVLLECDGAYHDVPGLFKSLSGWLAWLCDEVNDPLIDSGYQVFYTERVNQYRIVRPDHWKFSAVGKPLPLLWHDLNHYPEFKITDVFSTDYGAACIVVVDPVTDETYFYSDIL